MAAIQFGLAGSAWSEDASEVIICIHEKKTTTRKLRLQDSSIIALLSVLKFATYLLQENMK